MEGLSLFSYLQEFLQMVANKTGIRDVSLESVWSVYDTLFCEVNLAIILQPWELGLEDSLDLVENYFAKSHKTAFHHSHHTVISNVLI